MEITTQDIAVQDESQIAEARRRCVDLARRTGFDDVAAGRTAIVVTELATNLLRHGGGGRLLVNACDDPIGPAIQCIALDNGPGIADLDLAMQDGYSTNGTAGQGLGAVRRQSDVFDIYSRAGSGTAVLTRIAGSRPRRPGAEAPYAALCTAIRGETVSGDAWSVIADAEQTTAIVADGLGHGPIAAEAAAAAVEAFARRPQAPLTDILGGVHAALRSTRGGAVALVRVPHDGGPVRFAGIGNISGSVLSGARERRMVSHNGTAGHIARHMQEFTYDVTEPPIVILHSDGIGTSWQLDRYPALRARHPALIAGVIYHDFARGRDDASILVIRSGAVR